jgi:cob(I)alamin adenosyltransferase
MSDIGYVQIYTGNGKGKTTAALGICLRAICAGHKVFVGQFMKGQEYSELKATEYLPCFEIEQFGTSSLVYGKPSEEDKLHAKKGLLRIKEVLTSGEYEIVVMDEINTTLFFELVELADVLAVLDMKPRKTELILTGRYAPAELIERADLVTEMQEIKHYYEIGVGARKGIEE